MEKSIDVNQLDAIIKGGMHAGEMPFISLMNGPSGTGVPMERLLELERLKRVPVWVDNGTYYGYPDCCIKDFCTSSEDASSRNIVIMGNRNVSGFIPCSKHKQQILNGEITLSSLIDQDKRQCPEPFVECWK